METGELVIRILQTVSWPIAIIIIVIILRRPLGQAILTISRLRYKDFEAEFGKVLEDSESRGKELELPPPEDLIEISTEPIRGSQPYDILSRLAEVSPRSAVAEAWRITELSLMEAAKLHDMEIDVKSPRNRRQAIHRLFKEIKLGDNFLELYESLRKMRNDAVHAYEFELDSRDAMRYVDLSLGLANRIRMLSNI